MPNDPRDALTGRRAPALVVLTALLDRSLVQIAEASADARVFDRETIRAVSDVWDNNTLPLFGAVTARTRRGRERRARAALQWMAAMGPARRSWMLEQAAAAGHVLEAGMPPEAEETLHSRDHQGKVMPRSAALTTETACELGADYDLTTAQVRTLRVERSGARLTGFLVLAAARRYRTDKESKEPAELDLWLEDVTDVDCRDAVGITLRSDAGGVVIGIGAHGSFKAAGITCWPDDGNWHLSAAGRIADAQTPPRHSEPRSRPAAGPRVELLGGAAYVAAAVLHRAMLEIRSVRYSSHADRIPVSSVCRIFAGSGAAVLTAGAHRRAARREAAFRQLVEGWIREAGAALAPWFTQRLQEVAGERCVSEGTRAWTGTLLSSALPTPRPPRKPLPVPLPEGELRLAAYTAAHVRYSTDRDASALLHLAMPPDPDSDPHGPWRLRALTIDDPHRFQLRMAAFDAPGRPQLAYDRDTVRSFSLHGDSLTASAPFRG